jgi:hypothetical protein
MFNLKKTVSFASAVSIASLSTAMAEEPPIIDDDIFTSDGMLELSEKPLTTAQLSEARGGYNIGGIIFNITVVVSKPEIEPFPDGGPFGEEGVFGEGGVFGEDGGPFEDGEGPIGESGVFGEEGVFGEGGVFGGSDDDPASADTESVETSGPGSAPPLPHEENAVPTPSSSASQGAAGETQPQSPEGNEESNSSMPSAVPEAPSSSTNTAVPNVDPATQGAQSSAPQDEQSGSAQQSPQPTDDSPAASSPTLTGNINSSGDVEEGNTSTSSIDGNNSANTSSADSSNATGRMNDSPSNTPDPGSPQTGAASQSATSRGEGASNLSDTEPAEKETGLSFSLEEVSEPEVIQRIGPEGILTILNNTLDNQRITTRVDINIEVPNFTNAMSLTKASNLASRTFSQNIFLGGLR